LCLFVCVCACAIKCIYTCMYLQDWGQMSEAMARLYFEQKIEKKKIDNVREKG